MSTGTESMLMQKEIFVDSGIFPLRTMSGKFSASASYMEHLETGALPSQAPKRFKHAVPYLYYVPEQHDLISYTDLHQKIAEQMMLMLKEDPDLSEHEAKLFSSKNVMNDFGIDSHTMMLFSPDLTDIFNDSGIIVHSASYNHDDNLIYISYEESAPPEEEKPKVDVDELKKKYNFKKPQGGASIRDIINQKNKAPEVHEEESEDIEKSPEEQLKDFIQDCLHTISGNWEDNVFTVNYKESGYLLPVERVELHPEQIIIMSSPITNTEWWTKFTPIHQCPRFEGAMDIPDEYAPFCQEAKCNQACGAEDGFVELSAARFRLIEESEIIQTDFKRLQDFLDRAYHLIDEFRATMEVDIHMDIRSQHPYFYAVIDREQADESTLSSYFEAFLTLFPEITDIRGRMDIEEFTIDEDFDAMSEDGLVHEARNYGLQEMVRLASVDMLNDIVQQKDGRVDANFYLIDGGKIRYLLKNNRIESYREEMYMGNVTFKKGLKEINNFFVTTLGGGRW